MNAASWSTAKRPLIRSGKIAKRLRQLIYIARNLRSHRDYTSHIGRFSRLGLTGDDAFTLYKYVGDYLTSSFDPDQRRNAILSHYKFVEQATSALPGSRRFSQPMLLWQLIGANAHDTLRIMLQPSQLAPMEGELELQFTIGSKVLSTLTFIFASSQLIGSGTGMTCIVGGLQGGVDCRADIRRAAKLNGEIAPSTMLLIAAKALSNALSVDQLVGVSSDDQVAYHYAKDLVRLSYDDMWIEAGASGRAAHFHVLVPEGEERPLSDVPLSHRRRTRRKRERKAALREEIEEQVNLLLEPAYADADQPARVYAENAN